MSTITETVAAQEFALRGQVSQFGINSDSGRRYITVTVPFSEAREIFHPEYFNAKSGKGEQRYPTSSHVKKLESAMMGGTFTPCAIHAGLHKNQQKEVVIESEGDKQYAIIKLSKDNPGVLTNGNHRISSLSGLLHQAVADKKNDLVTSILAQPVTVMLMLDGDTKRDFLALQIGKTVDPSHMLVLKTVTKQLGEKHQDNVRLAIDFAKILNGDLNSPLAKQIRFDTSSVAPIPISAICSKGASDLGSSLVGAAKLCLEYEVSDKAWYPNLVTQIYTLLKERSSEVLGDSSNKKVLTPPPEGTKASATMMLAVANCVTYYLKSQNRDVLEGDDVEVVLNAVKESLDRSVAFSSPMKRELTGDFARALFENVQCEKHDGVPVEFITQLCTSTFGVSKLPKKQKPVVLADAEIVPEVAEAGVEGIDEFQIREETSVGELIEA